MRKNRTKHEAKKPRLAKRALALCFALIFVCSCLLPAFANSEVGALAGTQETVVEPQQDEQKPTEPVLLNEGGTDSTEGNEQHQTADDPTKEPKSAEQEPKADEPKNEGTTESKDSTEQQGNEQTKPEEPKTEGTTESKDSTEEPKNEGTTEETKPEETKPEGTTEEPKTEETKPEEPKQPTTNTTGDTINQGEATYTYRFWPDKIDAFDLEAINADVKSGTSLNDAAQSRAGMVPCTVLTVMTNANLRDYQANVQQPTKSGYEFAGWYTVEGTTEDKFSFEQSLNFEESKTIDVFAKWEKVKAEVKQIELGGKNVSVEVEDAPALNVSQPSDTVAEELGKKVLARIDWDKFNTLYMFDLEPKNNDGLAIDSAKKVTISGLNIDSSEDVKVFHLGANFEEVPAEVSADGTLTFTPSSFSPFAIALADDSVASYPEQDDDRAYFGEDYIMLADEAAYDYTVQEGKTISVTGQSADWWRHEWSSSNTNVATVSGNSRTATVTGVSAGVANGVAKLTHTYWDKEYYGFLSYEWKEKTETKTVKVTPKEYANQNADIFFLKTPTSSVGSNASSEWLPQNEKGDSLTGWTIDGKNIDGVINVTGATWDSKNKNIVLNGQTKPITDFIKQWPDGTTEGVWKLYRKCPANYTGTDSSLNEATFDYVLRNIWGAYQSQLKTDLGVTNLESKNISEITLTPYKISKNASMHIDCEISVTGLACTAKFYVEPAGDVGYQQVFGKNYSSSQKVTEPSATELNSYKKKNSHSVDIDATGIPPIKIVHGVRYSFAGWYPENGTTGKPDLSATKSFPYTLTREDMERGVVNFYARYVPDQTVDGPDDPYITVEKKIVGLSSDKVDELVENFTVKVGNNIELKAQAGNHNYERDRTISTPDGLETTLRWKIDSATESLYNVTESGYDVGGYNVTTGGDVGKTFNVENATFTAHADVETSNSNTEFTVGEEGNQYWVFVASLTNPSKNVVMSSRPLSAQERAAIVKAVKDKNQGAISRQSTLQDSIFYSITEGRELELDDNGQKYKITYNDYKIRIEAKEMWNMVAKVSYSMTDAPSADIKLTNTYTPATTSLTVAKHVEEGNAKAPDNAEFKFKLTVGSEKEFYEGVTFEPGTKVEHAANTNVWEFTLTDGDSIKISGIRLDDNSVKVEEVINDNHYTTKHKVNDEAEVDGKEATFSTLKQNSNTVDFTNTYNVPNLKSMTIKKVVTGAFGERTKDFTFKVELTKDGAKVIGVNHTNQNGANVTDLSNFTLKHGQQVTLEEIPIGTTITITETDANDYDTKATNYDKANDKTFVYEVVNENGTAVLKSVGAGAKAVKDSAITVTNNFDGTPDTGVLLDTLPYLILLAVAVAGGVLVVVRKRKHRDE